LNGLILTALALLAIYLKSCGAFSFDLKSPAFLIITRTAGGACCHLLVPNPVLTIAKSAELWCVALAADGGHALRRQPLWRGKLATVFALSMVVVIGG
jgi:hypothetical protein